MWFKTRVGLFDLPAPLEIRVGKYLEATNPHHAVFARTWGLQTFQYDGRFGSANVSNATTFLAMFHASETAGLAIARCMKLIEEAIHAGAKACDLSQMGDPDAWPETWNLVEWQPWAEER